MRLRAQLGDRRGTNRFKVSGQLWASLDVSRDAICHDISTAGALLELRLSRGLTSIRTASITLPGGPELPVHVQHISRVTQAPGDDRYLVGVEFVALSAAARHALEQLVRSVE